MTSTVSGEEHLILWAGCVQPHDLLARADALQAGGFSSLSVGPGDIVRLERERGWSLERIASELRAREAPVSVIDAYPGWYPGWTPIDPADPWADWLNVSEEAVFRYADAFGAGLVSLLGSFDGASSQPLPEVAASLGELAEKAEHEGLRLQVEVVPTTTIPDLETGSAILREVRRSNAGLVLDTFHLTRSGCTPGAIEDLPPGDVFSLQICDGPLRPQGDDYFEEIVKHRLFAGDGEQPVADLVGALLRGGTLPPLGPEVFSLELHELPAKDATELCGERTRAFLTHVKGQVE